MTGLNTYTQYLVSLEVFNPEGGGPETVVVVMTDEGGENFFLFHPKILCDTWCRLSPYSVDHKAENINVINTSDKASLLGCVGLNAVEVGMLVGVVSINGHWARGGRTHLDSKMEGHPPGEIF